MAPRKGAKVASITERDLNDVLEVRKGMEVLAISLACERITKEEMEHLEKIEAHFQTLIESDNLTELAEVDVEFHDTIYQATNNKRLVQLLNNLREQMYRYRMEYLKDIAVRRTLACLLYTDVYKRQVFMQAKKVFLYSFLFRENILFIMLLQQQQWV